MQAFVGMSGWAYKEWKGAFYPADLKTNDFLRHYATRFPAVEINNSFYRMPTEKLLLDWAAQVPDGFRFVLKASRRITHIQRLADQDGSLEYFLRTTNVLGEQLGATLFQCPPSLRKDVGRLQEFLARIPRTWRAALEFRHPSWFDDQVYELLRSHDVPLVAAEDDEGTTPLVATASWGYVRLRRLSYREDELAAWADAIKAQPWNSVFVFLKHDEDGRTTPKAAQQVLELL